MKTCLVICIVDFFLQKLYMCTLSRKYLKIVIYFSETFSHTQRTHVLLPRTEFKVHWGCVYALFIYTSLAHATLAMFLLLYWPSRYLKSALVNFQQVLTAKRIRLKTTISQLKEKRYND